MDNILMKMNQMFSDKTLQVRSQSLKTAKLVIEAVEEERRRTKHQEELVERITATNQQVHSVCNENGQLVEENRTISRKRMNSSNQLKIEQKKAEDFQATIIKERNRLEEKERVSAEIQNKAGLLLKPYQELLGVTFQLTPKPQVGLRLLFQMPGGKKSMIKLTRDGPKIVKCVPELENLKDLEMRLAETNDYAGFVTHVRSLFLKSADF